VQFVGATTLGMRNGRATNDKWCYFFL